MDIQAFRPLITRQDIGGNGGVSVADVGDIIHII
jgi:hypothetical protein